MTAAYPGVSNTYLVSHEATNNLIVGYSRNPKDFALTEYIQIVPVTKNTGAYLRITADEAARVLSNDLKELRWGDGEEAPMHAEGLESHEFDTYRTTRYALGFSLGDLTIQMASWDLIAMHAAIKAQQAMTARTVLTNAFLETTGNYDATHTATATAAGGGKWDVSTVTDLFIKKSLRYAALIIKKDTLGQVSPKDLVVVVNPNTAAQASESAEVHSYLKESPFALAQIRGDSPSQNGKYGLPDYLYGYKFVIEDAVQNPNAKGATSQAKEFVQTDTVALMLARVGGIQGMFGGPSFTTASLFMLEEMTVETKRDDDNRRTKGRVVENYAAEMTAPSSGFLFTGVID